MRNGTSDAEQGYAEEIVELVLRMQENAAAKQRRPLARGTHAKGICARAQFEVFDVTASRDPTLGARLAKGIFAQPGIYPATVRFANSDPHVNSDYHADVRSLSFSVDLTHSGTVASAWGVQRQDFSMQSASTLPINDARAFLATMKVLAASSTLKGFRFAFVQRPAARHTGYRTGAAAVASVAQAVSATPVPGARFRSATARWTS